MRTKIEPMIRAKGVELVRRHLGHGDLCAIVTSTNAFITAPIAREFGLEHLVATELEVRDGRFTGKPTATPCFREGKITLVEEWLARQARIPPAFTAPCFYTSPQTLLPPPVQ